MGNSVWLTINGLIVISTWMIIAAVLTLGFVLFMTRPFPKIRKRQPINLENNFNINQNEQNVDTRSDNGGDESSFRTGTIIKQPSSARPTDNNKNNINEVRSYGSTQLCEEDDIEEPNETSTLLELPTEEETDVTKNDDKNNDGTASSSPTRTSASSSSSPFSRLSPRLGMMTPSSLRQSFSSSSTPSSNNNTSTSFMRRLSIPTSSSSSSSSKNNANNTNTNNNNNNNFDCKPFTPAQKHLEHLLSNDLSLVLHTEDGASRSVIFSLNNQYQLQYMSKALLSSRRTGIIDLSQVLTITTGKNTNVFHYSSSAAIAAEDRCCFSLISDQSTFDIETTSVSERDALVSAIQAVHQEAIMVTTAEAAESLSSIKGHSNNNGDVEKNDA